MLTYDRFTTPLGQLTLVRSPAGICYVGLPATTFSQVKAWCGKAFPRVPLRPAPEPFHRERHELLAYVRGERTTISFALDHHNTPFATIVLDAVGRIPYGETASYRAIADRVGRPRTSRAVGRAVATNPLPLAIPCHRVIGSDGSLTGYGGGLPLKQRLLELETGATWL